MQALFDAIESEVIVASLSLTEFARRLRELGLTPDEARQTVSSYLDLLDEVVPVTPGVALTAFNLGCLMLTRLPLADALIAAAAQEREACLVHRDQHMAQIPKDLLTQLNLALEPDP